MVALGKCVRAQMNNWQMFEADPKFATFSRHIAFLREGWAEESYNNIVRLQLEVYVVNGDTGSGKTRSVYDEHGFRNVFKIGPPNQYKGAIWYDGYRGQDVLLIDEFAGWIGYRSLLQLLDVHPLRIPVKGGFTYAGWTKVYICTTKTIEQWYPRQIDLSELERRIKLHIYKAKAGTMPPVRTGYEYDTARRASTASTATTVVITDEEMEHKHDGTHVYRLNN